MFRLTTRRCLKFWNAITRFRQPYNSHLFRERLTDVEAFTVPTTWNSLSASLVSFCAYILNHLLIKRMKIKISWLWRLDRFLNSTVFYTFRLCNIVATAFLFRFNHLIDFVDILHCEYSLNVKQRFYRCWAITGINNCPIKTNFVTNILTLATICLNS